VCPTVEWFSRYLRLLGVPPRRPGRDALFELTSAHLTRIPFENVSKLYYRRTAGLRGLPDPDRFLDGITRWHVGGTCYSNAFYLNQLLVHLGYEADLCGADMSAPDVHLVNLVTVDGRRYLVDVGYAAPFLEPFPLDLDHDQHIVWGRERYVLKPLDAAGRPRLEVHRDGALKHGYRVNPVPRRIEEFVGVIADSFGDRATFMHALLIARFWPGRSLTLRNLTLVEAQGTDFTLRQIPDPGQLPDVVEEQFGIPAEIARVALDGVDLSTPL
jgi:N-hydroxyarylamine O-acetyltransferase